MKKNPLFSNIWEKKNKIINLQKKWQGYMIKQVYLN